jgi:hypothetical protein
MNESIAIEFDVDTTDPDAQLGVKIQLDDQVIYENAHVVDAYHVCHAVDDDEGQHQLVIELFGKNDTHTVLNTAGEIVKDAMLALRDFKIAGIDATQAVTEIAMYHHDFNGTQPAVVDKFFGDMGCNGQVRIKFTTPIGLWLLENL